MSKGDPALGELLDPASPPVGGSLHRVVAQAARRCNDLVIAAQGVARRCRDDCNGVKIVAGGVGGEPCNDLCRPGETSRLANALRPNGIDLSGRQVRRYLKLMKASYRRTASTLEHKQDPQKVERAEATLDSLKKSAGGQAEAVLPRRERLRTVVGRGWSD